jgi:hypothetical protein
MSEQKKERHHSTMTQAELDAWDAETEADYQKTVSATTRPGKRKRARYIGCPWEFFVDVRRRTHGSTALTVALYVYRQTRVHRSQTITLSGAELAELGVDRSRKREALMSLEAAGIVRLSRAGSGQSTEVTLLWRPASL